MTRSPKKRDQRKPAGGKGRPPFERERLKDLDLEPGTKPADQIRGASFKCQEPPPSSV